MDFSSKMKEMHLMKKILIHCSIVLCGLLVCSCQQASKIKHCFVDETDGVKTIVVIEEFQIDKNKPDDGGAITVYERKNNKDLYPPQKTLGFLKSNEFKYADGTILKFDNANLTMPVNNLFNGETLKRAQCKDVF